MEFYMGTGGLRGFGMLTRTENRQSMNFKTIFYGIYAGDFLTAKTNNGVEMSGLVSIMNFIGKRIGGDIKFRRGGI